jgi:site-specific recombinase XerD
MRESASSPPARQSLADILQAHIQTLAPTLRPGTVDQYRCVTRRFLTYLHTAFPRLRRPSQLRRDPHLLGWFGWSCEQLHLGNKTRLHYLLELRRLFRDLAENGYAIQPDLIRREDFPPLPHCLPKPLSPEDDQLLHQELLRTDDLPSHALRLIRATGMRIGECIDLSLDCLRHWREEQWALHVPLGKMHTERLVPVDQEVRQIVARILTLRALAPPSVLAQCSAFLLPRPSTHSGLYRTLKRALIQAGQRAGCSQRVTPHRLRHTYATEMLRLGVGLLALKELLGHKDIRMTMRYLQVTQDDLQREFQLARQNALQPHRIPELPVPHHPFTTSADLPGIRHCLTATRHLLEMYRRQLHDEKARASLQRLAKRLFTIDTELQRLKTEPK